MAQGDATVNELAAPFNLSLPGVSKHLKVLQHAGLISQGRRAQWRPCRLEPERLKDAADWIQTYRHIWEERFDRLDDYLRDLQHQRSQPTEGRTACLAPRQSDESYRHTC